MRRTTHTHAQATEASCLTSSSSDFKQNVWRTAHSSHVGSFQTVQYVYLGLISILVSYLHLQLANELRLFRIFGVLSTFSSAFSVTDISNSLLRQAVEHITAQLKNSDEWCLITDDAVTVVCEFPTQ
jgi:hypothetical protein